MVNQGSPIKVLVVHPEKQHSLYTVSSLQNLGIECHFITCFYFSGLKSSFLSKILTKKLINKLNNHSDDNIKKSFVHTKCTLIYLIISIIRYIDKNKLIINLVYPKLIYLFNKEVLTHIKQNNYNHVIAFDTLSGDLFKQLSCMMDSPKLIVDMSAATYLYMQDVYINNYLNLDKKSAQDVTIKLDKFRYQNAILELKFADFFITASNFTKNSIVKKNVNPNCIEVIPYGLEHFNKNNVEFELKKDKGFLHILFVGNVCFEKGIHTLIESVKTFNEKEVKVTVVGEYKKNNFNTIGVPRNFTFVGWQSKPKLLSFYTDADVLILPSLCDGFGFVVTEALNFGLPVICSDNVGASELIDVGVNGFIFEAGNSEELKCLISDIYFKNIKLNIGANDNSEKLNSLTWLRYGEQLKKFLTSI